LTLLLPEVLVRRVGLLRMDTTARQVASGTMAGQVAGKASVP
jgi:hypothetical protein